MKIINGRMQRFAILSDDFPLMSTTPSYVLLFRDFHYGYGVNIDGI